ncbi:GntR family transcriptional regulator [Pelagibacterium montanilacus]|uniref:GntR family transcriptional regulator n=1 Tax=Pelagibacterium montanilacus TaxID=2185280 RepID=UPI000F8C87D3|nr:GntR family transcriptional regulator [Pelagibacterium montanilacus]
MAKPDRKILTRYAEIEATLRREIESGQCPIGTCLPTEHELTHRFGASRFTIRRAISDLKEAGFVAPRPGIGTMVIADRPKAGFVQSLGSLDEMLQYPPETHRRVLATGKVVADDTLAATLHAAEGTTWYTLEALRSLPDGMVIAWIDAWIAPRFKGVLTAPNAAYHATLRQIEDRHGYRASHAHVDIFARRMPKRMAEHVEADPGSPALVIRRRYRGDDGETFLMTETFHPENRFGIAFDFQRG